LILFFRAGRLGNQIIQYSGLRKFFPNDCIILIGMPEIGAIQNRLPSTVQMPIRGFLFLVIRKCARALVRVRLVTAAREMNTDGLYRLKKKPGLFRSVIVIEEAYFQNELAIQLHDIDMSLLEGFSRATPASTHGSENHQYFLHVRRGDYLTWPSLDHPAALPDKWFFAAMKYIKSRDRAAKFLVFSDDPDYCVEKFTSPDVFVQARASEVSDLTVMGSCAGGILSPSSFSWSAAAAIFRQSILKGSEPPLLVAPKFWAGHRTKRWFPPSFISHGIHYIEVDETDDTCASTTN